MSTSADTPLASNESWPLRAAALALMAAALLGNKWLLGSLTADGDITVNSRLGQLVFLQVAAAGAGICIWRGWLPLPWHKPLAFTQVSACIIAVAAAIGVAFWGIKVYNDGHDHTELVSADLEKATLEQQQWTKDFYERSLKAAIDNGWFDFETAMRNGFQPDRVNRTHFPNLEYMFDDVVLDPERPEWLVYHETPHGKTLMALMFFTRTIDEVGPNPGGPLALWHYHPYKYPTCAIGGIWAVGDPDEDGTCPEGELVDRSPEMFHVWFIDHPLGRYTEMKIIPEYWQNRLYRLMKIHPVLVHFAIALFVVAVVLDLGGLVLRKASLHAAAWYNMMIGIVFVAATIGAGMTAEVIARPTVEAHETLDVHKLLAFSFAGLLTLLVIWRAALRGKFPTRGAALYAMLSLVGVGLVGGAGYYGGEMVYKHGTGVRIVDRHALNSYLNLVQTKYLKGREARTGLEFDSSLRETE